MTASSLPAILSKSQPQGLEGLRGDRPRKGGTGSVGAILASTLSYFVKMVDLPRGVIPNRLFTLYFALPGCSRTAPSFLSQREI